MQLVLSTRVVSLAVPQRNNIPDSTFLAGPIAMVVPSGIARTVLCEFDGRSGGTRACLEVVCFGA